MMKNPHSYTVGSRETNLTPENPYEYVMIFDDNLWDRTNYVTWNVQIRKLVFRESGWRDTELVKEVRMYADRGSRKALLAMVLTKLSGDEKILEQLANELWYTHEIGVDIPPGLYAEFFPSDYEDMMRSLLWSRNKIAQDIMES